MIGVLFIQGLVATCVAPLAACLPYMLTAIATNIATGQPLGASVPIWTTLVLTVLSLIIATLRFSLELVPHSQWLAAEQMLAGTAESLHERFARGVQDSGAILPNTTRHD